MSACISRSGEFSEHALDNSHTCTLCHVLDEDALRAELEKLRAECVQFDEANTGLGRALSETRAELARATERLDRRTAELRDAHNDLLDVRGILSPAGYEPVTPLPLVPTVAPAVQWLVDRLAAVEQDRDRLAEHSKTLNAIGFAAAIALGDVPPGADQIQGNPLDQISRLLDAANPSWVRWDNLTRANAHLAHAATMLAAEPSGEAGT